jgi:hypothetical protein
MHGIEEEEERARPMAGEVKTCRRQEAEQEGRKRRGEDQWLVR